MRDLFPETAVGGYSRVDGTVDFYSRVNALLRPEDLVVDFGAGRGGFLDEPDSYRQSLRTFKGKVRRVVGVDVDDVVLKNPTVDDALVWQPGTRIELEDDSVDLVVSDFTFEHIEDPSLVVPELRRILKPGGWVCARTPNRWGYIAIGARMVPNRWHARVLERVQPGRQARDVFPTRYELNTMKAVRRAFPEPGWDVYGYTSNSEPAYFANSRVMISAIHGLSQLLPQRLGAIYMFFIRKQALSP
jgi:SAM-dependent methyltransferase